MQAVSSAAPTRQFWIQRFHCLCHPKLNWGNGVITSIRSAFSSLRLFLNWENAMKPSRVVPLLLVVPIFFAVGADWNRFRGPNGSGISLDAQAPPTEWSPTQNLKWKLALPGAGVSCPIVVADRVFVTCYSGYGESREDLGDIKKLVRHLVCVSKASGEILWQKSVPSTATEDPFAGMGVPQHGYASHTPVSDGKHVFVFFGKSGVFAFDLEGNQLWQTNVGTDSDPRRWGSSSSPIVHDDSVIVPAGAESRAIVCLDKSTGNEKWRCDAEAFGMVWGTPAVVDNGDSSAIVIGAPYEVWALNPENGKLRWFCEANEDDQFSSSVVVEDSVVYAVGGRGGGSVAVKAGGKDDVTKSNVVWKGRDSTRFSTPIVHAGKMFYVSGGVLTCLDATDGKELYKGRLRSDSNTTGNQTTGGAPGGGPAGGRSRGGGMGGDDYASPILAGGKIYYVTRGGDMYVLEAAGEFKQLAVNRVTTDREDFSATPAVSDGAIFVRSNKYLYCIAE